MASPIVRPKVSKCRRFNARAMDFCQKWARLGIAAWVVAAAVVAGSWVQAVHAEGIQPLNAVVVAVRSYLVQQNGNSKAGQLKVAVTPPDPRLRLAACRTKLRVFTPPGQNTVGDTVVGVGCTDVSNPWSLYVQASVALIRPVLVARYPMSRGTALSSSDVALVNKDVARMTQGYLVDINKINGMLLKYSVTAGTVLRPALLRLPITIKRGDHVVLMAQGGGIQVKMAGIALTDGAVGDVIRVRNLSSHRVVQGTVVSAGVVQGQF